MPEILFSGLVRNKTGARKGSEYQVTLLENGEGSCECLDFIQRGQNGEGPLFRCRHLRAVIERDRDISERLAAIAAQHASYVTPDATPVTVQPATPVTRIALRPHEIRKTGYRAKRDVSL